MTMGEITNITRIDIEGKAAALIACDATAAQERLSHAHNVSGGDWHGDCPFALYEGHGTARIIYNIDGEPVALASGAFALTLDTHHDGLVMMRGDWDGIEDLDLETD